jgi:hypothetical protein
VNFIIRKEVDRASKRGRCLFVRAAVPSISFILHENTLFAQLLYFHIGKATLSQGHSCIYWWETAHDDSSQIFYGRDFNAFETGFYETELETVRVELWSETFCGPPTPDTSSF